MVVVSGPNLFLLASSIKTPSPSESNVRGKFGVALTLVIASVTAATSAATLANASQIAGL
jgi:hypothetical protein